MPVTALHMTWRDLAFLHWPVAGQVLRPMVPPALEIETFDGQAWVGVIPFEMRDVRLRTLPPVPTASDFPELNVRTYVRHGAHSGVWFFSLDAASRLAVAGARIATGLSYYHAQMSIERGAEVRYRSTRDGRTSARFDARYRPTGAVFNAEPGTFEHWCTQRLSLFSTLGARLLRLDIEHAPWPLQPASVTVAENSMASAAGIDTGASPPHALFASELHVRGYLPEFVA